MRLDIWTIVVLGMTVAGVVGGIGLYGCYRQLMHEIQKIKLSESECSEDCLGELTGALPETHALMPDDLMGPERSER